MTKASGAFAVRLRTVHSVPQYLPSLYLPLSAHRPQSQRKGVVRACFNTVTQVGEERRLKIDAGEAVTRLSVNLRASHRAKCTESSRILVSDHDAIVKTEEIISLVDEVLR